MAAQPHELLKISLEQLKKQNDAFIAAQYDAAVTEARKKAANMTQLLALEQAFEALETSEKREQYADALEKAPAVKKSSSQKDSLVYVVSSENTSALKKAYTKFVTENYKKESDKTTFIPKTFSFANQKEFEKHCLSHEVSAEDRDNIIKAGFPSQVIALPFKNQEDADKFRRDMMRKGLVQQESSSNLHSNRMRLGN